MVSSPPPRSISRATDLAESVGNGTLRITTRQEFQLHGVLKDDLTTTIRQINETLLSTLAACGDVERNVFCCPGPAGRPGARRCNTTPLPGPRTARRARRAIGISGSMARKSKPLAPASRPPQIHTAGDDAGEPIYGKTYLPRKFKSAFALPNDNCTDIYANDLGFLAIVEEGGL